MNIKSVLADKLKKININFNNIHLKKFEKFLLELKIYNEKFNLTRITENIDIINKHFIDSIYIMNNIIFNNKKILDFGTGAGFPGIPLSILNSNSKFVLLDSNMKKIDFIKNIIKKLQLQNCSAKCIRVEEYKIKNNYDIIITRAVSNLFIISELALPLLKLNGIFVAMKSINSNEEILKSKFHIEKLGGKLIKNYDYLIPDTNIIHRLIIIKKVNYSNKIYPRNYDKILKESQLYFKR